ncbi:SOUL family heme-binding protein [Chromatocurvus halotolerans]|nr:heme-binding protein [Chromatocurvus halotolerans]
MIRRQFIILAVLLMELLAAGKVMAIEEAKYTVRLAEKPFELRDYAPHIVAETVVSSDFEGAGSQAFNRLFQYIAGNNRPRQKIAMTSPVGQSAPAGNIDMTTPVGQEPRGEGWAVSFMMPSHFTLETLPEPESPEITLRQVPARTVAAVRYSGFWSQSAYDRNEAALREWIEARGLQAVGPATWAKYNPPFMPWFLRRNEILVPVRVPASGNSPVSR